VPKSRLSEIVNSDQSQLLSEWMRFQTDFLSTKGNRVPEAQLRANCQDFLTAFGQALENAPGTDIEGSAWNGVREFLTQFSRERAAQGFTPSETAIFVFSLKKPIFARLRAQVRDADTLADETWYTTELLDKLGLHTAELYQKSREQVIQRQQQELLELSTPVVELWHGVLALPLIGTLDSARTQVVMQNLLEAIVAKSADLAIIDITGVPTVDTLVAQHLLKTVAAARLMGADCLISGIRPQIAQTIIHLGVDLGGVITKATLADAFHLALKKKNLTVSRG